jgi:hypothetical protein
MSKYIFHVSYGILDQWVSNDVVETNESNKEAVVLELKKRDPRIENVRLRSLHIKEKEYMCSGCCLIRRVKGLYDSEGHTSKYSIIHNINICNKCAEFNKEKM